MNSFNPYARFEKHADKTFAYAAARYLEEFQGKSKSRSEAAINSLLPYIGTLRLIEIDDEALKQFKHDRLNGVGHFDRPAMVGTCSKELTQCVTILNRACRVWRMIPSAPKLLHPVGEHRKGYPLTWDEQDRLFRCLPTGWDCGAACFAINTGVRKAELFGLKWVDKVPVPELDTYVFILHEGATKNGYARAVIVNSIAKRAVEAQWKHQQENGMSEFVFPSKHNGRKGSQVREAGKVFMQAWKAAGLPKDPLWKKGIHNLRFSFATRLRAAGVDEETRNALLGHCNHNLAQHYALPDLERLIAAAEKVTERRETVVLRQTHDHGAWEH